jgi:hypothetical protein
VSSVTIKSAGEQYEIALGHPVAASGPDKKFAEIIARLVEGAIGEYSVAFGGKASFVAKSLKDTIGAEIVSVDEPPSEKGVVY